MLLQRSRIMDRYSIPCLVVQILGDIGTHYGLALRPEKFLIQKIRYLCSCFPTCYRVCGNGFQTVSRIFHNSKDPFSYEWRHCLSSIAAFCGSHRYENCCDQNLLNRNFQVEVAKPQWPPDTEISHETRMLYL